MFKIGFESCKETADGKLGNDGKHEQLSLPQRSVVQIYFPARNVTLSYYNDSFSLKRGDVVYVEGKMEGLRGRVVEVAYNFKIKRSDYRRVIGMADTCVKGTFYFAGSHFVSFDRAALPYEKILTWFKAPETEDEDYVSGSDGQSFLLDDLSTMKVSSQVAQRGHNYFLESKVRYLCLDGTHGRAIVEGSQCYELEFEYCEGEISGLTCSCFCSFPCKHAVAAMLQLKETLENIEKNYPEIYAETAYFAAVSKDVLLHFAVDNKETGSVVF